MELGPQRVGMEGRQQEQIVRNDSRNLFKCNENCNPTGSRRLVIPKHQKHEENDPREHHNQGLAMRDKQNNL